MESFNKTFDDVNQYNDEFNTVVQMISIEMISKNKESIIIEEYELHK